MVNDDEELVKLQFPEADLWFAYEALDITENATLVRTAKAALRAANAQTPPQRTCHVFVLVPSARRSEESTDFAVVSDTSHRVGTEAELCICRCELGTKIHAGAQSVPVCFACR